MADSGNVFVSHIGEDEQHIGPLKSLLADHGYKVRDSSITSEKPNRAKSPDYIKHQVLAPQIDWSGAVVVLISPGMRNSQYVDFEIEYAQRHDKQIVGVWTHGAADADVPDTLKKYADAVVAWRGEAIRDAICGDREGLEDKEESSSGALSIARRQC